MAFPAATILRDFNTDGVPASGVYDPPKLDFREWCLEREAKDALLNFTGSNIKLLMNETDGNVQVGVQVRPFALVDYSQVLLDGNGCTLMGSQILIGVDDRSTYTTVFGHLGMRNASNAYACDAFGLRVMRLAVAPQYGAGFATDALYSAVTVNNALSVGPKSCLYKTSVVDSTVVGVGAGYAGGILDGVVLMGNGVCDDNNGSTVRDITNLLAIGRNGCRLVSGNLLSTVWGNNGWSLTAGTGTFNTLGGRSIAPLLTSGGQWAALGDGALQGITTSSSGVCIGMNSGATGNFGGIIAIGHGVQATAANEIRIGSSSNTSFVFAGHLLPRTDNLQNLGSASFRLKEIFCANATINTSDARAKYDVRPIDADQATRFLMLIEPVLHKWKVSERVAVPGKGMMKVTKFRDVAKVRDVMEVFEENHWRALEEREKPGKRKVRVRQEKWMDAVPFEEEIEVDENTYVDKAGVRDHVGGIAQQVRQAQLETGFECSLWGLSDPSDPDSEQHLRSGAMVWPMLAMIQQQQRRIEALEAAQTRH